MDSSLASDLQKPTQETASVTFLVAKMLGAGQSMVAEVDSSRVPFLGESLRVGQKSLGVEVSEKQDIWHVKALKQVVWVGFEAHHNSGL
jgi:hypothetical protein